MTEEKREEALSRIYTIPLRRAWIAPRHRRAKRAINIIREFARRHMKSDMIKIDEDLNRLVWSRGIRNPPRRVVVKMEKDDEGLVEVSLLEAEKRVEEVVEAEELEEPLESEESPSTADQTSS